MGATQRLTRVAEGISETIFRWTDKRGWPLLIATVIYFLAHLVVALGRGTL